MYLGGGQETRGQDLQPWWHMAHTTQFPSEKPPVSIQVGGRLTHVADITSRPKFGIGQER